MKNMSRAATNEYIGAKRRAYAQADRAKRMRILDAGVNAVFRDAVLDGRRLASGTWGRPDSPAQNKDGTHFSGTGMITVIGGGTMLVFR